MNNKLLLPRRCRLIGFVLLPFSITLLIAYYSFGFSIPFLKYHLALEQTAGIFTSNDFVFKNNFAGDFTGTVGMVATFMSLFGIAFSRLRHQDEYVEFIRLRALQLSVYANYLILVITALTLFNTTFLMVIEINLFTILILFILIFNYSLYIKPRLSKNGTI